MTTTKEILVKCDRKELLSWKPPCPHQINAQLNSEDHKDSYVEAMHARSSCCMGWSYTMRRYMQEVAPGLFLGPLSSATASNFKVLEDSNITHIVCIRGPKETIGQPKFPQQFKYLVLEIADKATESIIPYFYKVRDFINESLQQGGKTLVHGTGGISRSAALVIAYIMEKYGLTYKEAHYHLQKHRFCINPNSGFAAQLSEFEPIYQAKWAILQSTEINDNETPLRGSKRPIEDVQSGDCEMDTN